VLFVKVTDDSRLRQTCRTPDFAREEIMIPFSSASAVGPIGLGASAPPFSLESLAGGRTSLESYRGRRVLLSFLRNAQCAVCNLWVHEASLRAPAWRDAGLDVIAVFESTSARLRAQFAERKPPFPILADPDGSVHEAYGARSDPARIAHVVEQGLGKAALARAQEAGFPAIQEEGANFFRLPAEVLIEVNGTVAHVHIAENVVDHMPLRDIEAFIGATLGRSSSA
jgi:thioredoxin-dependent peroxiredoxin